MGPEGAEKMFFATSKHGFPLIKWGLNLLRPFANQAFVLLMNPADEN